MPRFAATLVGGWVLSALKQFPEPSSGLGRFVKHKYAMRDLRKSGGGSVGGGKTNEKKRSRGY